MSTTPDLPTSAAEHIKLLRTQRKWTQSELAARVGVPQPTIARYESGSTNPSFESLLKVLKAGDYTLIASLVPFTREQCATGDFDDLCDYQIAAKLGRTVDEIRATILLLGRTMNLQAATTVDGHLIVAYGRPPAAANATQTSPKTSRPPRTILFELEQRAGELIAAVNPSTHGYNLHGDFLRPAGRHPTTPHTIWLPDIHEANRTAAVLSPNDVAHIREKLEDLHRSLKKAATFLDEYSELTGIGTPGPSAPARNAPQVAQPTSAPAPAPAPAREGEQ